MKKKQNKLSNWFFHDLKLSVKLMSSYVILLAIPTIVVAFFLYDQLYDIIVSDTIRSQQVLSEQTVETIGATMRQVINTSNMITEDSRLSGLLDSDSPASLIDYTKQTAIQTLLDSISRSASEELVMDIKIYIDEPYQILAESYPETFQTMKSAKGTYWYGIFKSSDISELCCPTFYLSPTETQNYGNMAYIKQISNESNSEMADAYIAIYFKQDALNYILKQDISVSNSVSYIINHRNAIVASSDMSLSGLYYMDYDALLNSIGSTNTFVTKNILGTDVFISYYSISQTDWYLVSAVPVAPLLDKGNLLIGQFVGFYVVFLAIAFLLAYTISGSIVRRISSVISKMQGVRSGKLTEIAQEHEKDEIGDLIETYNYMTNRINFLMEEQAEAAEDLRIAEFKALQAQINPHFLYNTLDMINWQAKFGEYEKVTEAVQALSRFYKLTLSKKSITHTVEQELEHVSLYIQLQNLRYGSKIEFIVDVPENLLEYQIPKLTFQPIAENAIQHGILETDSKEGSIVLTGWKKEDIIVFLLSDDGAGMDAATLANILIDDSSNRIGREGKSGSNIGIYNTHRRLVLLYGEGYGLSYASSPGQGTEVSIAIPSIKL